MFLILSAIKSISQLPAFLTSDAAESIKEIKTSTMELYRFCEGPMSKRPRIAKIIMATDQKDFHGNVKRKNGFPKMSPNYP